MEESHDNQGLNCKQIFFLLFAMAVLVFIGLVFMTLRDGGVFQGRGEMVEGLPEGQLMDRAKPGEVVRNFPDELLIVLADARVVGGVYEFEYRDITSEDILVSFSINSAEDIQPEFEQPTVQYMSDGTFVENVHAFTGRLKELGWEISVPANTTEEPRTSLYAVRGDESLNVTFFLSEDGGVVINSSYLLETSEAQ